MVSSTPEMTLEEEIAEIIKIKRVLPFAHPKKSFPEPR